MPWIHLRTFCWYCKEHLAEATYNLYIDGLEPVNFEDSSHITLSVRNDFICKIVSDRYLDLLKEAFKSVLGFDVEISLVVPSTPPHEVILSQQYDNNPLSPQGNYEFTSSRVRPTPLRLRQHRQLRQTLLSHTTRCSSTAAPAWAKPTC